MADYLISGETLTDTADSIRSFLQEVGDGTHIIDQEFINGNELVNVEVFYYEQVDAAGLIEELTQYTLKQNFGGGICQYGYEEDNSQQVVPVIYTRSMVESGYYDKFFYVGTDEIGGKVYDKWRKIENMPDQNPEQSYLWSSAAKNYIYTTQIVVEQGQEDVGIDPAEFPEKIRMVYAAGVNSLSGQVRELAQRVDDVEAEIELLDAAIDYSSTLSTTFKKDATFNGDMEVEGQISGTSIVLSGEAEAQSFNATSDARLKENFEALETKKSILDLPIYKYDFINGLKGQIGCKAQDLQEICPEIVHENEAGYLSIQESKIVYLLIEEIKQLKKKVEELRG